MLDYTIKVSKSKDEESNIRGYATVTLANSFELKNIKIVESKEGKLFISMPSTQGVDVETGEKKYYPVFKTLSEGFQEELSESILEAFNNLRPPKIYATITSINTDETSATKAFAKIEIDGAISISGVALMKGVNGYFVNMPSYKLKDESLENPYKEYCHSITSECNEEIIKKVTSAYEKEIAKINNKEKVVANEPTR